MYRCLKKQSKDWGQFWGQFFEHSWPYAIWASSFRDVKGLYELQYAPRLPGFLACHFLGLRRDLKNICRGLRVSWIFAERRQNRSEIQEVSLLF